MSVMSRAMKSGDCDSLTAVYARRADTLSASEANNTN